MSFMSKIKKPVALGLAIGGGALTLTGAVLLGVGCNYKVTEEISPFGKVSVGVGSQNKGRIYANVPGVDTYNKNRPKVSYKDYVDGVKASKKTYDIAKKAYDDAKKANLPKEALDPLKEALDIAKAPQTGYALMVSGAVLFSIFVLVMAFGITAIIMNKKGK